MWMFTGIVSAAARVVEFRGGRMGIDHAFITRHLKLGGSVAVNGCCLTVVKKKGPIFYADVVPETLRRTNLGALKPGSGVNIELPLTATSTLDGHLVQGHIDATASVLSVRKASTGREVTIELPASLSRYVAEKGSIAVDGVSLTVASVGRADFGVALIPHTLDMTIANEYKRGSVVNLEVDVIARYVARNLRR
jgi:riboflavin synthase